MRQNLSVAQVAERATCSPLTVARIEKGAPTVAIGINYPGWQYTQPDRDIFGCFSDALPDRWGRLLLNRREQIIATEENRPVRKLSSFDYLIGIDDFSRMGGFRFKTSQDAGFINCEKSLRIPPLTDIHTLVTASMEIEKSEEL